MKDFSTVQKTLPLALLLSVVLSACGGGGFRFATASIACASTRAAAPPPPPPPPPPTATATPPPPPPASTVPPLSSTVVSITDNHQIGVDHWNDGNTATGGQGQTVSGLDCLLTMIETYHVHTHVSIFLNGEALSIPPDVGIVSAAPQGRCFYSIHTHDKSGKIHVEAAAPGNVHARPVVCHLGSAADEHEYRRA